MRVLVISPFVYPHIGGSENYLEELYTHIKKFDNNYQIDVISYNTNNTHAYENYKGLNIYRIPCFTLLKDQFVIPNYLKLIVLLIKLSLKKKYDIVNTHTRFFDSSVWGLIYAKIIGARALLTDHCCSHPVHRLWIVSYIAYILDKSVFRFIISKYDAVVVSSKTASLFYEKNFTYKKLYLITGGVNPSLFKPRKINKLLINGVNLCKQNTHSIFITFIGRLIPSKGPSILLSVAKIMAVKQPKAKFVFAGSGPLSKHIKNQARKLKNVVFVGKINRKQVSELLSITDIFVNPSTHAEGIPNVVLEASACGCAVMTTPQFGCAEVISHLKNGYYITPDVKSIIKGLDYLISNPENISKFGKNAKNIVTTKYNWNSIARQFLTVLKK